MADWTPPEAQGWSPPEAGGGAVAAPAFVPPEAQSPAPQAPQRVGVIGAFAQGLGDSIAHISKAMNELGDSEAPAQPPMPYHGSPQEVQDQLGWHAPPTLPPTSIPEKVASAAGGMLPVIGSGPFAPLTAGAQGYGSAKEEVEHIRESGGNVTPGQEQGYAVGAGLLNAGAVAATGGIVKGANLAPGIAGRVVANIGVGAGLGAAQQAGQNVIARQTVEPNRPISQGTGEAAIAGGIQGGAFSGLHEVGRAFESGFVPPEAKTGSPVEQAGTQAVQPEQQFVPPEAAPREQPVPPPGFIPVESTLPESSGGLPASSSASPLQREPAYTPDRRSSSQDEQARIVARSENSSESASSESGRPSPDSTAPPPNFIPSLPRPLDRVPARYDAQELARAMPEVRGAKAIANDVHTRPDVGHVNPFEHGVENLEAIQASNEQREREALRQLGYDRPNRGSLKDSDIGDIEDKANPEQWQAIFGVPDYSKYIAAARDMETEHPAELLRKIAQENYKRHDLGSKNTLDVDSMNEAQRVAAYAMLHGERFAKEQGWTNRKMLPESTPATPGAAPESNVPLAGEGVGEKAAQEASAPSKLFGKRRRQSGMINVPAIAEGITAAGKATKKVAQDVQDFTTIEPLPKMRRVSHELADAATEHASAYIAVPHVVNDLLSKVFPEQYHDPEAMAKTVAVLNADNILGGYDSFVAKAKKLQAAGDEAGAARATASADAIASKHDLNALDNQVQTATADVKANIDRWKKIVNPEMDRLYNEVKRVDPAIEREGRGRHFDARINLLRAGEEGSWAKESADKPMPTARANAHRNPDVRRDRFDRSASFTGDYSTDAHEVLSNVFGPRMNEASKLNFYDALVDSGAAVEVGQGETAPKIIQGKPGKWLTATVPETDPVTGETRKKQVGLVVRDDLIREVKDVLDTDQRLPTNPIFKALTNVQLFQLTDAVTHSKNLLSVVSNAQGAGNAWKDVTRKLPFLASADAVVRIGSVAREVAADGPEIRAEIAEMAKRGLVRPDYGHSGIQKVTGAALQKFDTASRVIMNRFFDNLVERGLAKDSEFNRRKFVNQVGVYNRRLMGPAMRAFRDYGISPFIVAGRNFNRQGRRALFGTPGYEAASKRAALQARTTQILGTTVSLAAIPMMLNAITTGNPMGRSGTPIGAWDTGKDDENGNRKVIDILQVTGARRGLRSTGLEATMQGVRDGKDINTIVGNAITDIAQSAAHPWVGPGVGGAFATLTGRRLDMRGKMEAHKVEEGGGKQYVENFRAAMESQNPLIYSMVKPVFTKLGMDTAAPKGTGKNIVSTFLKSPYGAAGVKSVRPGTTAAEDMADTMIKNRMGNDSVTIETATKIATKRQLSDLLKSKPEEGRKQVAQAITDGKITTREAKNLYKKNGMSGLQWDVRMLSAEEAVKVFESANEKEQAEIEPLVQAKLLRMAGGGGRPADPKLPSLVKRLNAARKKKAA